jgi:hypothetical protein
VVASGACEAGAALPRLRRSEVAQDGSLRHTHPCLAGRVVGGSVVALAAVEAVDAGAASEPVVAVAATDGVGRGLELTRLPEHHHVGEPLRDVELCALAWLGMVEKDAGDLEASRAYLGEALRICQALGKRREECRFMADLGEVELLAGDYAAAAAQLEATLLLARELGIRVHEGIALLGLGMEALARSDYPERQRV